MEGKSRTHDFDGNRNEVSPRRDWKSKEPAEKFILAVLSGRFGLTPEQLAIARQSESFDEIAYQRATDEAEAVDMENAREARAALASWKWSPWKGFVYGEKIWIKTTEDDGHWESIADQPAPVATTARVESEDYRETAPEVSVWLTDAIRLQSRDAVTDYKKMSLKATNKVDKHTLEQVYRAYVIDPEAEIGNLQAALYAFAPLAGRYSDCENLLKRYETDLEPDDILGDFVIDVADRLKKGQHCDPERNLSSWIKMLWKRWFFPERVTEFHETHNLESRVSNDEFDNDEAETEEREPGVLYWIDVEREIANRDREDWNAPDRRIERMMSQLNDPDSEWGKLSESGKAIIRALVQGKTKGQAIEVSGLSKRGADKFFEKLKTMRETTFVSHSDIRKNNAGVSL